MLLYELVFVLEYLHPYLVVVVLDYPIYRFQHFLKNCLELQVEV